MIHLRSGDEVGSIRASARMVAECLDHLETLVAPGVSTAELDKAAEEFVRERGALPAFKGYRGYPATLCVSLNDVVVHGIPDGTVLEDGDIGHAVQSHVEAAGFSVVRDLVGHGIGRQLHEDPQVPNYGRPGRGLKLTVGQVLAIEPMVNVGRPDVYTKGDGWTVVTRDGRRSAHFEHTIAVGRSAPEILSTSPRSV